MIDLIEYNSEYKKRLDRFIDEVKNEKGYTLTDDVRYLVILASLAGEGADDAYEEVLDEALKKKVSPVLIKEMIYQATDYLGYGRALPFIKITDETMIRNGVSLPLASAETTTEDDRLQAGVRAQVTIFGEHMREAYKQSKINEYLAANCFGDYYTRKGLDLARRELITFCFLMAQGDSKPQLIAHARGNMNMGNDKEYLMRVVIQCLPYIGYPRSLNAISCIEEASQ